MPILSKEELSISSTMRNMHIFAQSDGEENK